MKKHFIIAIIGSMIILTAIELLILKDGWIDDLESQKSNLLAQHNRVKNTHLDNIQRGGIIQEYANKALSSEIEQFDSKIEQIDSQIRFLNNFPDVLP
jgi:peptidoglycan hydrolase CwlO-like protein